MNLSKDRNRLTDMDKRRVVAKQEQGGSEVDWQFEVSRCKLLYLEGISYEVLLYSTNNYI